MASPSVASHSPGRLRLSDNRWYDADALEAAVRAIAAIEGVERLEPNVKAASLVVLYDRARLSPASLVKQLAGLFGEEKTTGQAVAVVSHSIATNDWNGWTGSANRAAKIGLLATTGLTVAALSFSKKVHAAAGWAGIALLAVHLLHHRRKILR